MRETSALTLTLADVARLAHVSRPVVSMWRRRELAGSPFPSPVHAEGQERFDAFEVAEYLAATGRGNNPDARADLAAHARLTAPAGLDEATVADGLTALLCLVSATDEAIGELDHGALLSLARTTDPDDTYLCREIDGLGSQLPRLAAHAESLADASYSPAAAFELVLRQQLSRTLSGHAKVLVRDEVRDLVARVAVALATQAEFEAALFVDPTDGSGDLLLTCVQSYAAEFPPSVAVPPLDTRSARLVRRRLHVHDTHRVEATLGELGDLSVDADGHGVIYVLQLPSAGRPDLTDGAVLDMIHDLIVNLAADARMVILGPASALVDAPKTREQDRARDAVLRSDRLRAIVRLPEGLLARSPRKGLALYALGTAHPEVPVGERWTVAADVSGRRLKQDVIEELVTDVVASMSSERLARAHSFRFARRVPTAKLLPGRKPLTRQSAATRALSGSADAAALVDQLVRSLEPAPISRLRVETGSPLGSAHSLGPSTLDEALAAGELRIVAGHRIDPTDLQAADGTLAVGVEELLGLRDFGERRADRLTFATRYPSVRFTEPGDVVFCSTPKTAAWVDRDGGTIVVSPARVLRIRRDPDRRQPLLLPEVLAADIAGAGTRGSSSSSSAWRRWPVRQVPQEQRDSLARTLAAIAEERKELRARLERLDNLAAAVTDGVTTGALTIATAPPSPAASDH